MRLDPENNSAAKTGQHGARDESKNRAQEANRAPRPLAPSWPRSLRIFCEPDRRPSAQDLHRRTLETDYSCVIERGRIINCWPMRMRLLPRPFHCFNNATVVRYRRAIEKSVSPRLTLWTD
jgi:hypothetical protein